jgi:hypothetical protein
MDEIQEEYRESTTSLDEGLFVLAFWTLVWGPIVAVALLQVNKALVLVTPIVLIVAFRTRRRKVTLEKYRPIVMVLAAFLAGYCWYAYREQNSDEFRARAAALEACTKFKSCVDQVQLGGFDIGPAMR